MAIDKKNVKLISDSDGIKIYKATKDNKFYKNPKMQTYSRRIPVEKKVEEK